MLIHKFCKLWSYQRLHKGFVKCDHFFFSSLFAAETWTFISLLYNLCYCNFIWLLVGPLRYNLLLLLLCFMLNTYLIIYTCIFLTLYFCWHSSYLHVLLIILSPIILIDNDHFTRAVMTNIIRVNIL